MNQLLLTLVRFQRIMWRLLNDRPADIEAARHRRKRVERLRDCLNRRICAIIGGHSYTITDFHDRAKTLLKKVGCQPGSVSKNDPDLDRQVAQHGNMALILAYEVCCQASGTILYGRKR